MTCEPLMGDRGEELLTSYLAAFPAKTSAQPGKEGGSTANGQDSGVKWLGSLAKYDRDLRSWKTPQCWLFEDLERSLETWPKWGMTLDGAAYQRPTPSFVLAIRQRITAAKESGSRLPTPRSQEPGRTSEGYGRGLAEMVEGNEQIKRLRTPVAQPSMRRLTEGRNVSKTSGRVFGMSLAQCVEMRQLPTPTARDWKSGKASQTTMERNSRPLSEQIGGKLNPQWVEWLMGWPIGWTDLEPLEMDKFRTWRS
jgi:hypothetical protein